MVEMSENERMELESGIAAFEAKHFSTALRFLAPFAERGLDEAQYRMAVMVQNGLGMVANEERALAYMQAAAEQGHSLAQHGLGFMYMQGECVGEPDGHKAIEWFAKAAEQGMVGSMTTIAMIYDEGIGGVPVDKEQAKLWYRKAGFDEFG